MGRPLKAMATRAHRAGSQGVPTPNHSSTSAATASSNATARGGVNQAVGVSGRDAVEAPGATGTACMPRVTMAATIGAGSGRSWETVSSRPRRLKVRPFMPSIGSRIFRIMRSSVGQSMASMRKTSAWAA